MIQGQQDNNGAVKEGKKTLSIEEVLPFFLDQQVAAVTPDIRLYRVDGGDNRYYYTMSEDGVPSFYLSVTSFTSSVLPASKPLMDWRIRLGKEESEEASRIAASYGTFLHICIAEFMRSGVYNHQDTFAALDAYMTYEGIPGRFYSHWIDDIENDMLAFAQFALDRKLRPLAIEFPLCDPIGLAGMIDLVCLLEFNRKDVAAIVDFKSGRKGFWDSHELQGHTYKNMWNKLFKGTPFEVEMVFNWAPKAWRDKPTYELKNQMDSIQAKNLPLYLELFKNQGLRAPSKKFTKITDVLEFGGTVEGKYSVMDLTEFITLQNEKPHASR